VYSLFLHGAVKSRECVGSLCHVDVDSSENNTDTDMLMVITRRLFAYRLHVVFRHVLQPVLLTRNLYVLSALEVLHPLQSSATFVSGKIVFLG